MAKRSAVETADILKEARKRFTRAYDWEATARTNFLNDLKFAEGDSYNKYQWPNEELDNRAKRPTLTINRVRQHNLDILNDARQSRVAVKLRPVRGGASYESAQVLNGVIKHIEYISNADSAYQHALSFAVRAGWGYIRLVTDYVDDQSFDQEIYIRRVADPLTVLLDPDITEFDGSDARFGFVYTDMPRDQFERAYPDYKDIQPDSEIGAGTWVNLDASDKVRIAEYFRCVKKDAKLYEFNDPQTGEPVTKRDRDIDKAVLAQVIDDPSTQYRTIVETKVEHFTIIGDQIAEEKVWPGKYIPLIRCIGEETIIDGRLDRKGHTRSLLDAQRMANYNAPLSLDTPLPTPSGWTTMGDVKPGDWLLGEAGQPVQVDGLSPIFLMRDCYRVAFDDGSTIVADAEHKWSVETRGKRVDGRTQWRQETVTTADLAPKTHYIYLPKPVELPEAELPIDPYVLGCWLGDGSASKGVIHAWKDDADETAEMIRAHGFTVSAPRYYASKPTAAEIQVWGLHRKLKDAGVFENKHIPAAYLRASKEQRLELLRGLMDTDGNVSRTGHQCSWVNVNERLADGFAELIRTLGLKATERRIAGAAMQTGTGKVYQRQDCRRFHFSPPEGLSVFGLRRKRDLQEMPRPRHPRRTNRYKIVSVERVPWEPTRCVGVKSGSHLFLAGEGMIPTHNSASVEYGALQSKVPWLAPAAAIEEHQKFWETANIENHSVLPWTHIDEDGNEIPPPTRPQPPSGAPVFMQGFRDAIEQMYLASGQNQADFGMPSNERSGVAIENRQREGDKATYHYLDHQASMIILLGKQFLDLFPHIYDTERLLFWRDDAGNEKHVKIDPNAPQHYQQGQDDDGNDIAIINPKLGVYDVQSDVGPSFATQREAGFAAFSQLLGQNKELVTIVGDLWMRLADYPGAEEAAERMRRMVPQQALEDGPAPDVIQLKQQLAAATKLVDDLSAKLKDKTGDLGIKEQKTAVEGYRATTDRIGALKEALATDPHALLVLVREVLEEAQFQSAGGGAEEHAAQPIPTQEQLHPALGGSMPPPQIPAAEETEAA